MAKFMVYLKRTTTVYETAIVEIEADDEDDAHEKAEKEADNQKVIWEENPTSVYQRSAVEVTDVDPL